MIIVMKEGATRAQIDHVFEKVRELGYKTHPIYGEQRTVIGAIGDERGKFRLKSLESVPGVESVIPILKPYKLVGSELKKDKSIVRESGEGCGFRQRPVRDHRRTLQRGEAVSR